MRRRHCRIVNSLLTFPPLPSLRVGDLGILNDGERVNSNYSKSSKQKSPRTFKEVAALLRTSAYKQWSDNLHLDDKLISVMRMVADCDEHEGVDNVLIALYLGDDGGKADAQIQFQTWEDEDVMDLKVTHLYGLGVGAEEAFAMLQQLCEPYLAGYPGILEAASHELRLLIDLANNLVPASE